jgi:phosphatidylserine decarboxylase
MLDDTLAKMDTGSESKRKMLQLMTKGDPSAVFDPKNPPADPAQAARAAKQRLAMETERDDAMQAFHRGGGMMEWLEDGFESFDAFFTRPLRNGARSIDRSASTLVSPCDGELRDVVPLEREDTEVVAKGQGFTIGELLADRELAERFVGGTATTIYLHPRDYHRVHAPCDALAWRVTLVPGRLLPVTAAAVARVPRLFALNERMVHVLETGHGHVAVVMVAAFGVGHMTCSYHRFVPHPRELQVKHCDPPARLRKGDELGVFHLGSTVIVLTEPGMRLVADDVPMPLLLGQPLLEDDA